MDEEKGYEVIDKRKVKDGEVQPEAETPKPEEIEPNDEFNMPPVDIYSLLRSFIGMLGMQAWQWIGLVKDPSTGKLEKDLAQAKVAIDTIGLLAKQLDGKVSASEEKELRELISNLQLNYYVQQSKNQ
jgi:hypothetical protein